MARSIRISEKAGRAFDDHRQKYAADPTSPLGRAFEEVRRAIARIDGAPPSGLRQAGRKAKRKPVKVQRGRPCGGCEKCLQGDARLCSNWSTPSRQPTKAEKRDETADLWKQALARSGGFCECTCGRAFHEEGENKPEMDHQASRRVPQTITNVWMLPDHLRLGDQVENMADMTAMGTANRAKGERCARAKLTAEIVLRAREMAAAGANTRTISDTLGLSRGNVSNILRRVTWKHLPETRSALPAAPRVGP